MTRHDPTVRIRHILDTARIVSGWMEGVSRIEFDSNTQLQSAIIYKVQIIGEAAANLPNDFRAAHSQIPWTEIIGMRQILVHVYMDVDLDVVWNVATEQLPELVLDLERVLSEY
jgi:uncharacterized protein with HEPN domain